jgi:hypothetical protein
VSCRVGVSKRVVNGEVSVAVDGSFFSACLSHVSEEFIIMHHVICIYVAAAFTGRKERLC